VFSCDGTPYSIRPDESVSGNNWVRYSYAGTTAGGTVAAAILAKIAEGSDALTVLTENAEQSSHISFRISSADSLQLATAEGSSTNSDPPLLTLSGVGSPSPDVLWIVTRHGDTTVVATVAPSGYSNLQTQASAGASGASTNTAELLLASSDSQNPGTFTSNNEQWICYTIGIWDGTQAARATQAVVEAASAQSVAWVTQVVVEVLTREDVSPPPVSSAKPIIIIAT
jgi:hypothetical protein